MKSSLYAMDKAYTMGKTFPVIFLDEAATGLYQERLTKVNIKFCTQSTGLHITFVAFEGETGDSCPTFRGW